MGCSLYRLLTGEPRARSWPWIVLQFYGGSSNQASSNFSVDGGLSDGGV